MWELLMWDSTVLISLTSVTARSSLLRDSCLLLPLYVHPHEAQLLDSPGGGLVADLQPLVAELHILKNILVYRLSRTFICTALSYIYLIHIYIFVPSACLNVLPMRQIWPKIDRGTPGHLGSNIGRLRWPPIKKLHKIKLFGTGGLDELRSDLWGHWRPKSRSQLRLDQSLPKFACGAYFQWHRRINFFIGVPKMGAHFMPKTEKWLFWAEEGLQSKFFTV